MADRIDVKIEGIDSLLGKLTKLTGVVPGVVLARLKASSVHIEGLAKRYCPVRFGPLRNSISHEVDNAAFQSRIGTNKEYAPHVHFGTAAHTIQPRNARYLRFTVGGEVIYTKLVHHPGTKANPFLFRAFNEGYPSYVQGLADDLVGVARAVSNE